MTITKKDVDALILELDAVAGTQSMNALLDRTAVMLDALFAQAADTAKREAAAERRGIERAAQVTDSFTCGVCGMDGKASAAIRSLLDGTGDAGIEERKDKIIAGMKEAVRRDFDDGLIDQIAEDISTSATKGRGDALQKPGPTADAAKRLAFPPFWTCDAQLKMSKP